MREEEVILVILTIGDLFDELEDFLTGCFCIILRVLVDYDGNDLTEIEV